MPTILSANESSVLINSKSVDGLQEITYQTIKPYLDVGAIGTDERIATVYGLTKIVGTLRVRSTSDDLDGLIGSKEPFQIFAHLKHLEGAASVTTKEVTLQGCYLHGKSFGLAANGVVEVIYQFSATREK